MIGRFTLFAISVLGGIAAAYYGQPYVGDNADAILVIVTVLAVFAGFLVAIITIVGDPALIPPGSWRAAEIRRDSIESRLIMSSWLFIFYLIAIGLLFVGVLLHKAPPTVVSDNWKAWIERLYLFFGVASFLLTFGLPNALVRLNRARVDAEIERRRAEHGIKDEEAKG